jgi:hypothetical protein
MLKKKICANFQRIILFTLKIVTKLSKIWVCGFGFWDPGVKKVPEPGSGSARLLRRDCIETWLSLNVFFYRNIWSHICCDRREDQVFVDDPMGKIEFLERRGGSKA